VKSLQPYDFARKPHPGTLFAAREHIAILDMPPLRASAPEPSTLSFNRPEVPASSRHPRAETRTMVAECIDEIGGIAPPTGVLIPRE
jgi:hypothetical protein